MRTYVDPSTCEIVAVLSLSTWQAIATAAHDAAPCAAGTCTSAACTLMHRVLNAHSEREPLGPTLTPHAAPCPNCAAPVEQRLEHYNDQLGCWGCPARA